MSEPKLPPYSNFCKCAACGEYFNSEKPFAMHRIGESDERRCRTAEEMTKRGMSVSSKGYWVTQSFESAQITASRRAERTIDENQ